MHVKAKERPMVILARLMLSSPMELRVKVNPEAGRGWLSPPWQKQGYTWGLSIP